MMRCYQISKNKISNQYTDAEASTCGHFRRLLYDIDFFAVYDGTMLASMCQPLSSPVCSVSSCLTL